MSTRRMTSLFVSPSWLDCKIISFMDTCNKNNYQNMGIHAVCVIMRMRVTAASYLNVPQGSKWTLTRENTGR